MLLSCLKGVILCKILTSFETKMQNLHLVFSAKRDFILHTAHKQTNMLDLIYIVNIKEKSIDRNFI